MAETTVRIRAYISESVSERLDDYLEATGKRLSDVMDAALDAYLSERA